jgi:hypothetical protein
MKSLFTFFILFQLTHIWSQNHYLIEYDRILNSEKYYKLSYNHGTFEPSEIKKPIIKKGDVIKFRLVNVNPLVFQVNIRDPFEHGLISPGAKTLSGFGGILENLNGVNYELGSQLSALDYSKPDAPVFSRGETPSEDLQLRNEALLKLNVFNQVLKESLEMAQQYKTTSDLLISTALTKDEIIHAMDSVGMRNNYKEYQENRTFLDREILNIQQDPALINSDYQLLERSYEFLKNELDASVQSPLHFHDLREQLAASEFTKEYAAVLGYNSASWANEKFDFSSDLSSVEYSLEFIDIDAQIPSDDEGYQDGLLQSHTIELQVQTPGGFSWSTGFVNLMVSKGFNNYELREISFGDSVQITQNGAVVKSRLALATNLNYNFSSSKNIIPQLNMGMAIGFVGDENPLNILLGGGLKFRQFPFLGFSAGLAFCQNQVLNNGYQLFDNLENSNTLLFDQVVQRVYSPGYYFGINITL